MELSSVDQEEKYLKLIKKDLLSSNHTHGMWYWHSYTVMENYIIGRLNHIVVLYLFNIVCIWDSRQQVKTKGYTLQQQLFIKKHNHFIKNLCHEILNRTNEIVR